MNHQPKTLENIRTYQEAYYQQLGQLPYFNMIVPVVEKFLCTIISEGAFYLRVHASALAGIIESGQIKSMMETGTGATAGGPETRRMATAVLFGCDTDSLAPADYPKYGYLSYADPARNYLRTSELAYQYGNVVIRLKKERLLQRTTLCVGNSLTLGRCYTLIPTPVSRVRATCLFGLPHHEEDSERSFMRLPDPVACYGLMAMEILERRLTTANFAAIDSLLGDKVPAFEHFELQYHDPLNLDTDVERIDAGQWFDGDQPLLQEAQSRLTAMGIEMIIHD